MGNTFCGNPSAPALTSSEDGHETTYTGSGTDLAYGFSSVESAHLNNVRKSVCTSKDANIGVVWKHAHVHAGGENGQSQSAQRYSQLDAICNTLSIADALNCVLKQKVNHDQFLEFASNILNGGNYSKSVLDFVWEVCCCDGSSISSKDKIPARVVITLCLELSVLVHYMLLDVSVVVPEERNIDGEKNMIQSLTNSLLEYTQCNGGNEFGFGEHPTSTVAPGANDNESITRQQFTEWQRKILPDLLHNSIVQFFRILFFPPKYNNSSAKDGLFRQYTRSPILHSSKERIAQTAARLEEGEVVPIKSAVFGKNHVECASGDSFGRVANTEFSPEVFVFTTVSVSKFGNKWYRLFSGTEDGWTFNHLEHSIIGYQGPTLIVLQASSKQHPGSSVTFGAYTAAKWEKGKKAFFGSSDCFLFQLEPTLRVMKSLPKMGTRGGHYMYFHSNTNVVSNNLAKKDEMVEGLGFGGTLRNPRLFIDRTLEECRVSSQDTTFEEGYLGFPPSSDPLSSSYSATNSLSCTLHIDSLEIYAVGDEDTIQRGFQALTQYHDIADANLRNARTVDKAAFMGDLRNGVIESKAFAHRGQVDGRANGCMKGEEDGKASSGL